jgi:hypothetical protein
MNPGTTEIKNSMDFGLNKLENKPRQNSEADVRKALDRQLAALAGARRFLHLAGEDTIRVSRSPALRPSKQLWPRPVLFGSPGH